MKRIYELSAQELRTRDEAIREKAEAANTKLRMEIERKKDKIAKLKRENKEIRATTENALALFYARFLAPPKNQMSAVNRGHRMFDQAELDRESNAVQSIVSKDYNNPRNDHCLALGHGKFYVNGLRRRRANWA